MDAMSSFSVLGLYIDGKGELQCPSDVPHVSTSVPASWVGQALQWADVLPSSATEDAGVFATCEVAEVVQESSAQAIVDQGDHAGEDVGMVYEVAGSSTELCREAGTAISSSCSCCQTAAPRQAAPCAIGMQSSRSI